MTSELIKQLEAAGLETSVATQITGICDTYITTQRKVFEEEFKTRLQAAKVMCEEEVRAYKRELGNRVGLFLESRDATIQERIRKQYQDQEPENTKLLTRVKTLLEGIESPVSELSTENADLKKNSKTLLETKKTLEKQLTEEQHKNRRLGILLEHHVKKNTPKPPVTQAAPAEPTATSEKPKEPKDGATATPNGNGQTTLTESVAADKVGKPVLSPTAAKSETTRPSKISQVRRTNGTSGANAPSSDPNSPDAIAMLL